ncbi:MAG: glycosyltransferase family protein [Opitutae bacterium]|nr:glycosyltransferase family protein [Opitutae bacterium]
MAAHAPSFSTAQSLVQSGQLNQARAVLEKIIAADPRHFDALSLLGNLLVSRREFEPGIRLLETAVHLHPNVAAAHLNLGNALLSARQLERAAAAYRQAIAADLDLVFAHANLGIAAEAQGKPEEAVAAYREALRLNPNSAQIVNNLGNALQTLRRSDEAIAAYRQAITLKPDYPEPHNNLGNVFKALNRYDEAIAAYRQAIALKPDYIEALNHLANTLAAQGQRAEAIAVYRQSEALQPDQGDAYFYESLVHLVQGDFATGLPLYEYRWKSDQKLTLRRFPQPQWRGQEPLAGKTILLHGEQGLGDTLQFARFVSVLAAQGAKVFLSVQPPLKALLADLPDAAGVFAYGDRLPAFDFHCPLLSLPLALGLTLATIPAPTSYVHAPALDRTRWPEVPPAGRELRVGLVWSGNPNHKQDHNRSLPLTWFRQIVRTPRCRFFSLQKEPRPDDAAALAAMPEVMDLTSRLADFRNTAALVGELDLIITVDTSVAHLAGALGRRTWVLLPFSPDWRWLLERTDSPWYPTLRLFRQPAAGAWEPVEAAVRAELARAAGDS